MKRKSKTDNLYIIPLLTKAVDILELFQSSRQPMVLEEVHSVTNFSKTTVYRILKTLVHRGYLAQSSDKKYRYIPRGKKLRFGLGRQSADVLFDKVVTESLWTLTKAVGIDLIVLDNRCSADTAVRNVEQFVRERVDIVIELEIEQHAAPIIADKLASAKISAIAVDIPYLDATHIGLNNYRAGYDAGKSLAQFAMDNWHGNIDWIIGLDARESNCTVNRRITGAFEAIKRYIPNLTTESFVRIGTQELRAASEKVIRDFLTLHSAAEKLLIAATTDTSALGAITAIRDLGREKDVAVVGQGHIDDMAAEMLRPGSPAIASVSHGISLYAPRIVDLALSIHQNDRVAPYNYIEHKIISKNLLTSGAVLSDLG